MRVLNSNAPHNAKGVARMSDIELRLSLPTTLMSDVAVKGGAGPRLCCDLAEQRDWGQSAQR